MRSACLTNAPRPGRFMAPPARTGGRKPGQTRPEAPEPTAKPLG